MNIIFYGEGRGRKIILGVGDKEIMVIEAVEVKGVKNFEKVELLLVFWV